MNKEEALKMLESAPQSETKSAAVNKSLTQKVAVDIIRKGVSTFKDGEILTKLYEKRVWQVCKNQRRPRY